MLVEIFGCLKRTTKSAKKGQKKKKGCHGTGPRKRKKKVDWIRVRKIKGIKVKINNLKKGIASMRVD